MPSGLSCRIRVVVALALSFVWFIGLAAFVALPVRAQPAQPDLGRRLLDPPPSVTPIKAGAAVLIVQPVPGAPLNSDEFLQRRINTHVVTIASEQHLRRVIGLPQGETRKTNWFKESDNPLERAAWLRDHLKVTALPGTSLIQLTLDDVADPAERKTMLQEICATYLDNQRMLRSTDLLDQTSSLNNQRIKIEARLKDLRSTMREKQLQLNQSGGNVGGTGVTEIELSRLVQEQVEAQLSAAKARQAYEAMKDALQKGVDSPEIQPLTLRIYPFMTKDAEQIHQMEAERDRIAVEAGENSAKLKSHDAQLDKMRARYQQTLQEARSKARVMALEEAQQESAAAGAKLDALTKRVALLREDLGELNNAMVRYASLQQEEKALTEQLRTIKQQIDQIMTAQSSRGLTDIQWHLMPEVTR